MISHPKTRVQAIKCKFENLNNENVPLAYEKKQLYKHNSVNINNERADREILNNYDKHPCKDKNIDSDSSNDDWPVLANSSYLHNEVKRGLIESKTHLIRQTSDPGKKLHRSHAFRCERSQMMYSGPKRHGSCHGRSESNSFALKPNKKLSEDRLKVLSHFLEENMKRDNFVPSNVVIVGEVKTLETPPMDSIPDDQVPKEILDQYAKVVKPKKKDAELMTDSGVSSETENLDEDKTNRVKKLMSQFENNNEPTLISEIKPNLQSMDDLSGSSETMKLERKNPHLILTDTLKKALKQPLPPGPPPKKPPRILNVPTIPEAIEKEKKDPKRMLEKLEQVLEKRTALKEVKSVPSVTELPSSKPKEIHYLCTDILDITHRTLHLNSDPLTRCLKSLNCAITNSTSSLPYTRLSVEMENCPCSENVSTQAQFSTFLSEKKCAKCLDNAERDDNFRCHLKCKCTMERSEFFVDKEHTYDEPCVSEDVNVKKSRYGTLNSVSVKKLSKSMEDLPCARDAEGQKIYDIPYEPERPITPVQPKMKPKTEFQKLRQNFETGFPSTVPKKQLETVYERPAYSESFKSDIEKSLERVSKISPERQVGLSKLKASKSSETLCDDVRFVKNCSEKRSAIDTKRYRNRCEVSQNIGFSHAKKNSCQLDVDRENLNRLMNEIYETVTAVCNMDENKPGSFPTDQSDGSTSEDSVKLTRSLTEKRKNYVRRMSSRVAYLEPSAIKAARTRHQTSICSYRSEVLDNPYSTFRSWKSFRTSQNNLTKDKMEHRESTDSKVNLTDSKGNILSMGEFDSTDSIDKLSIDGKTGCVDIELPFEVRDNGLFNLCLLVGLNYMSGQAYVKSVFPSQVQVPPHIENLIFPETLSPNMSNKGEWSAEANGAQCYSLVLTDERGDRSYGYCRRVLPEGATTCLPLCYCLIGKYRAPGFYYKILQEIESHHGSSEIETQQILQQLFETDFPKPGESISIIRPSLSPNCATHGADDTSMILDIAGAKADGVMTKSRTLPDMRMSRVMDDGNDYDLVGDERDNYPDDLENNNTPKKVLVNVEFNRIKTIKRPIEPRVDEDNLSILLDLLGAGLLVKVFGSLLLERKVIIVGDKLSLVSSCLEALQTSLYPMVWQQPLISSIPCAIQRDVLEAPLPILGGALTCNADEQQRPGFHEGMLIDLTHPSKVLLYQGDEATILPTSSYKTLKTSLQMESNKQRDKQEDTKTRNVMISEAFLRFFVDILGDFWKYFSVREMVEGDLGKGNVVFDKESFIKNAPSKQNQYFLEWFSETAMFNHFVQNMAASYHSHRSPTSPRRSPTSEQRSPTSLQHSPTSEQRSPTSQQSPILPRTDLELVDTPLPDFYELFHERVRSRCKRNAQKGLEGKSNYKNAVNRKVKLLKNKLRDLVA